MNTLLFLSILVVAAIQSVRPKVNYAGYSVLELEPHGSDDAAYLDTVSSCSVLAEYIGTGLAFLCDRKQTNLLRRAAKQRGIKFKFLTRNLGRDIKLEQRTSSSFRSDLPATGNTGRKKARLISHTNYESSATILEWVDQLAARNKFVSNHTIGKSVERRDLKMVKINAGSGKPKIFIDAGIHAREWISPAATIFFIEKLVRTIKRQSRPARRGKKGRGNQGGRAQISPASRFEWNIVPLMNPDGYEYSRTTDRMWRKNKRKNAGTGCLGVDLNRNFPEGYGVGASKNPCDEVYKGPHPLSEPESQALNSYIEQTKGIQAAVSVHSYGNVIIFPWGYKEARHPNKTMLSTMANHIRNEVQKVTGEHYRPGTSKEVFGAWGLAGGATDDYYITKGIPFSYTFELPGKDEDGQHGFILPRSNIKKVGNQLYTGFMMLAEQLDKQ